MRIIKTLVPFVLAFIMLVGASASALADVPSDAAYQYLSYLNTGWGTWNNDNTNHKISSSSYNSYGVNSWNRQISNLLILADNNAQARDADILTELKKLTNNTSTGGGMIYVLNQILNKIGTTATSGTLLYEVHQLANYWGKSTGIGYQNIQSIASDSSLIRQILGSSSTTGNIASIKSLLQDIKSNTAGGGSSGSGSSSTSVDTIKTYLEGFSATRSDWTVNTTSGYVIRPTGVSANNYFYLLLNHLVESDYSARNYLSSISSNSGNIQTGVNNIASNMHDYSVDISDISTNSSNIQTGVNNIASNMHDYSVDIADISTKASNIQTEINNISSNMHDYSVEIADIRNNTSNLRDYSSDLSDIKSHTNSVNNSLTISDNEYVVYNSGGLGLSFDTDEMIYTYQIDHCAPNTWFTFYTDTDSPNQASFRLLTSNGDYTQWYTVSAGNSLRVRDPVYSYQSLDIKCNISDNTPIPAILYCYYSYQQTFPHYYSVASLLLDLRSALANQSDVEIRENSTTIINEYNNSFVSGNNGLSSSVISDYASTLGAVKSTLGSDFNFADVANVLSVLTSDGLSFWSDDVHNSLNPFGGTADEQSTN